MKKRCGGCQHWLKLKKDPFGGGMCVLKDTRASSDEHCEKWKAKPYERNKTRLI